MTATRSFKEHYSRALKAHEGYLHFCAHSHHLWPDVTREAQIEAWDLAARLSDRKWGEVIGSVLPDVQKALAERLGVDDGKRIAFAANTHEFFVRLLSCFEIKNRPLKILSTDSEFHSFRRQASRLIESGELQVSFVSQFPRETFVQRFLDASLNDRPDVIFLSHVFFNSGAVVPGDLETLKLLRDRCDMLVLDVYHSLAARDFSMRELQDDIYILGGSYKYLQGGEGACFLYVPPKADTLRPKYTGWYAHFESLGRRPESRVDYGNDAWRFWGSTFDPTALFRLRAVLRLLDLEGLGGAKLHAHSLRLQERCLEILEKVESRETWKSCLKEAASRMIPASERGNFLSFSLQAGQAREIQSRLEELKILSDSRESEHSSFLRFGFGMYHDLEDLEIFGRRICKD